MGLVAYTFCVRYIDEVSSGTASSFLRFCDLIRKTAPTLDSEFPLHTKPLTEELVSERFHRAMNPALGGLSGGLPAFGHSFPLGPDARIMVGARLSSIPHFHASTLDYTQGPEATCALRDRLARAIVDCSEADIGVVGADQKSRALLGKAWDIYFHWKVSRIGALQRYSWWEVFRLRSRLLRPTLFFPELLDEGCGLVEVPYGAEMTKFLRAHDRILLGLVGRARLKEYLRESEVSAWRFLYAYWFG
jgi:hypothetical protein